ncbi:hypothetical protein Q4F19_02770 [Sphingomonas sp. BIUV-7]|uniref:Uncharacterized protein n=1 Tax=Sphingomonas natans TaxID=3063330 RepID=A0ABT8Y6J1_9SPHN|nr:hypothetical protein [Sphingomonas sp. BIUV-7]MDO6413295.1 hypothetical protein [Sphingomonas sp. BIUV-7]
MDKSFRARDMEAMPQAPSPAPPRSIEEAARNPEWIAHRYDPGHDAVHLLPVSRAVQRQVTFLTDEYLPSGLDPIVVRRKDAIAAAPSAAPIHFVFHSAFCCSTLVARAFDLPGRSMGLKEPVILNDIIGWRRRGGQGPDMAEVLDNALRLLARPFGAGERVVVKPSNAVNALLAPILTLRPDAHALLLHAPLRTYLGSIARKGLDGRLWVRTLLLGLLDDKLVDLGFSPRDHLGQTDLQVAAVGWLAQQALFARVAERFGRTRIRTIDSATLMADPRAAMAALGQLFGMPLSEAELGGIVAGPAFTSHSKSGTSFGATERAAEEDAGVALHAGEIDKVIVWAQAVADAAGIRLDGPFPLIEDRDA